MYAFYTRILRFVAARSDHTDPRIATMMALLLQAADAIDVDGRFTATELDLTARAFAGVAAMLQKQILPETTANGHAEAERQIRWAIDTSMEIVNGLLHKSSLGGGTISLKLPPLPQ